MWPNPCRLVTPGPTFERRSQSRRNPAKIKTPFLPFSCVVLRRECSVTVNAATALNSISQPRCITVIVNCAIIVQMILAAVDDLLFSSKIRTTAKQAGVELTFARTPPEILDQARALRPALLIIDLNSAKASPIETIAALKRDAELSSIRTLGFVSHVHTDIIDAARNAGIDDVMARSAFAARLAEILLAASPSHP
jgi:PleD family two-component response regulator